MDPYAVTLDSKPVKKGRSERIPRESKNNFTEDVKKVLQMSKNQKSMNTFDYMNNYNNTFKLTEEDGEGNTVPYLGLINDFFKPYLKQLKRDEIKKSGGRKSIDSVNSNERNDGFFMYKNSNLEEENPFQSDNHEGNFLFHWISGMLVFFCLCFLPSLIRPFFTALFFLIIII